MGTFTALCVLLPDKNEKFNQPSNSTSTSIKSAGQIPESPGSKFSLSSVKSFSSVKQTAVSYFKNSIEGKGLISIMNIVERHGDESFADFYYKIREKNNLYSNFGDESMTEEEEEDSGISDPSFGEIKWLEHLSAMMDAYHWLLKLKYVTAEELFLSDDNNNDNNNDDNDNNNNNNNNNNNFCNSNNENNNSSNNKNLRRDMEIESELVKIATKKRKIDSISLTDQNMDQSSCAATSNTKMMNSLHIFRNIKNFLDSCVIIIDGNGNSNGNGGDSSNTHKNESNIRTKNHDNHDQTIHTNSGDIGISERAPISIDEETKLTNSEIIRNLRAEVLRRCIQLVYVVLSTTTTSTCTSSSSHAFPPPPIDTSSYSEEKLDGQNEILSSAQRLVALLKEEGVWSENLYKVVRRILLSLSMYSII